LARAKAEAELNRRLLELPAEVQALQNQLASRGLLMSGHMLKSVLDLSQKSLEAQGAAVTTHYLWALREALVATDSFARRLADEGASSLEPLFSRASEILTHACDLTKQPNLAPRLLADLQATHLQSKNAIKLALEAEYAVRSRGALRKALSLFGRLVRTGGGTP
jgi:hypothetical protein